MNLRGIETINFYGWLMIALTMEVIIFGGTWILIPFHLSQLQIIYSRIPIHFMYK